MRFANPAHVRAKQDAACGNVSGQSGSVPYESGNLSASPGSLFPTPAGDFSLPTHCKLASATDLSLPATRLNGCLWKCAAASGRCVQSPLEAVVNASCLASLTVRTFTGTCTRLNFYTNVVTLPITTVILVKIDSHWNHFQFVGKCKLFAIFNQHQNWTGRN
jgi:hypothetical protein